MAESMEAFVIMPFSEPFDRVYDDIIEPALEEVGYEVNKADSLNTHQNILEDIIKGISDANILIADLSTSNPNVFYEAGIAHGLGIPTVLITQDLDETPFDLRAYEIIEYSTQFTEIGELESEIKRIGRDHKDGKIQFGSPVSDFTHVDIADTSPVETEGEEATEQTEEPELGVLDYASRAEEKQSNLEEDINEIITNTQSLETNIVDIAAEIQEMGADPSQMSPKKANKLARDAANELNSYSDLVENKSESVEENLNFMMKSSQKFVEVAEPTEPEHRESLEEHKRKLSNMIEENEDAIQGMQEFKSELSGLRGINRELTKASNRLSSTLTSFIDIIADSNAKAERVISLINQKTQNGDDE